MNLRGRSDCRIELRLRSVYHAPGPIVEGSAVHSARPPSGLSVPAPPPRRVAVTLLARLGTAPVIPRAATSYLNRRLGRFYRQEAKAPRGREAAGF